MEYGYILVRAFAPLINLTTDFVNLFIWRDKKVILFGAWMGDKFADNTRFLFQYIQENREKYNLKKIIWVTRDTDTLRILQDKGYEVCEMHSLKSIYYHFKAGVHIVCNINFPVKGYAGDIMGQFSGHAIKLNTWHGIPLKAGKSTGENSKKKGCMGKIKYALRKNSLFLSLFTPGHWNKAYYLSTGAESTRRCSIFCGIDKARFIEAGYPRDCKINSLLENEKRVIGKFTLFKKVFLYVPTFRENGYMPHPISEKVLRDFLVNNHILWVEKPHGAAEKSLRMEELGDYVLCLDSKFDINVLLDKIDLVITDYSSVCYDAMSYDKPVLYFAPDVDYYSKNERGFLCDYKEEVNGFMTTEIDSFVKQLDLFLQDDLFRKALSKKISEEKNKILNKQSYLCGDIISIISQRTGALNMVKV